MTEFNPEKIQSLLKDLSALEIKHGFKNSLNIFEAAGLERQEIKHSRMLAFLLDPSKAHCLGGEILKNIVVKNFDRIIPPNFDEPIRPTRFILDDLGDLYVDCEWKNIDIIAYSDSLRFVVAIENKIDAKESINNGRSQLSKYAEIIQSEEKFKNFSKLFIYLTIDGEEPSDDRWCTLTHADILEVTESCFNAANHTGSITSSAIFFVNNYIEFLRRKIVTNPELESECRLIYQNHKEILGIIFDVIGARDGISALADNFAQKAGCEIYSNRSGKFAYLPHELAGAMPEGTLERTWWNQQRPLIFWFYVDQSNLKLIMQVGPMKNKVIRNRLISEIFSVFNKVSTRKVTDQYTVITSEKVKIDEDSDFLEEMLKLNSIFAIRVPELVRVLSNFQYS